MRMRVVLCHMAAQGTRAFRATADRCALAFADGLRAQSLAELSADVFDVIQGAEEGLAQGCELRLYTSGGVRSQVQVV